MKTQNMDLDYKHELSGDWSISGLMKQLDSLTDYLQKLELKQNEKLFVDCAKINVIDIDGLRFLKAWQEFARMRGVEYRLINLPAHMCAAIRTLGFDQSFSDCFPEVS